MLEKIAPTMKQTDYVTYKDYLEMAPEDRIMEWSEGRIISYMPPLDKHQDIVGFLHTLINNYNTALDLGFTRVAPYEVKLPESAREPDIAFVSHQNTGVRSEHRFTGAPDLVVEVVSRSSIRQDRVIKFSEYEAAGVKEYWLIDPRVRQQTVEVYALVEGVYEPIDADDEGRFFSKVLDGFWFKPSWLWKEKLPLALAISAEILASSPKVPETDRQTYQSLYDLLRKTPD